MPETILAFDYGAKRIGIAVGNTLTRTAQTITTLSVPAAQVFAAIKPIVSEWQPQRFVVGRPCHADGTSHSMTAACEKFARALTTQFARDALLVDERYSSVDAENMLREKGISWQAQRGQLDAIAAAVILERYFESLT